MNYYYDIVLDFQENNYHFYDIEKTDSFEYIKKIPVVQINNKTFKDIINYNIKVDLSFLKKIFNKTITDNGSLEYVCLFADKFNAIVCEFNEEGYIIFRSILPIDDELNIIDTIYTVELTNLKYEKLSLLHNNNILKKEEYIKHIIDVEINKLYKDNNLSKLQFLYLEWFDKKEENIDIIVKRMKTKLEKTIGEKEEKILNIIKMSYNNV